MKTMRLLALAALPIAQALLGFGAVAAFAHLMSGEQVGRYVLARARVRLRRIPSSADSS